MLDWNSPRKEALLPLRFEEYQLILKRFEKYELPDRKLFK